MGRYRTDAEAVAEYQKRFDQCEFFQLLEIRVVVGDSCRCEIGTQGHRSRFVAGVFVHDWWGVEPFRMLASSINTALKRAKAGGLEGAAFKRSGLINLAKTAQRSIELGLMLRPKRQAWVGNMDDDFSWVCLGCGGEVRRRADRVINGRFDACVTPGCDNRGNIRSKDLAKVNEQLRHRGRSCTCVEYGGGVKVRSKFRCDCGEEFLAGLDPVLAGSGATCSACSTKSPSDALYIGLVDFYSGGQKLTRFKCGKTMTGSMHARYAGRDYPSIDQWRYVVVGADRCNEAERELIGICREILGKPTHGNEWFLPPTPDGKREILKRFDKLTSCFSFPDQESGDHQNVV